MFHHLKFYPELFISWRRKWQPTPVFLPGKSHGQRNVSGLQSMGLRRIRHDWMTSLIHFCKLRVSDLRIMQICLSSVQFSRSVVSDSLWSHGTAAHQASLSITNSQSLLKLMSMESVMPSNHLILYCPLLLPPSIFPSIIFKWVSSLQQVAKVLEFQLQDQSFQWIFRTDFL